MAERGRSRDRPSAGAVGAAFVLIAVSTALFFARTRFNGDIRGRDAAHHVSTLLVTFLGWEHTGDPIAHFLTIDWPTYGPVLRVFTYPFWRIAGTDPLAFSLAAFAVFIATVVLLFKTLRALSIDPGWIAIAGILLLTSTFGQHVYFHYNIDGLSTLAVLWMYFVAVATPPAERRAARVWTVALAALVVRLTTLIYTAAPMATYLFERGVRSRRRSGPAEARSGWAAWIAPLFLLACAAVFYASNLQNFADFVVKTSDLDPSYTGIVPGIWSTENLTWFADHRDQLMMVGMWPPVLLLAAWGLVKLPGGRRLPTVLFAVAPVVPYLVIIGTRKADYLGPSLVIVLVLATIGLAKLPRTWLRWPVAAVLCFLCSCQFWFAQGLPPVPCARPGGPVAVAVWRAMGMEKQTLFVRPHDEFLGTYPLARRTLDRLHANLGAHTVAIASVHPNVVWWKARPMLEAFFEDAKTAPDARPIESLSEADRATFDALLVVSPAAGRDAPERAELSRWRLTYSYRLTWGLFANLYLPAR